MKMYKPKAGYGIYELIGLICAIILLSTIAIKLINSYVFNNVLKTALVAFVLYSIFYIVMMLSLKYNFFSDRLEIVSIFGLKKSIINFKDIDGYNIQRDRIKGMRLSGVGKSKYSLGRSVVDKVGICHMFVTSSKEIVYIHKKDISYGISPKDFNEVIEIFKDLGIKEREFESEKTEVKDLFKEKSILIPFILVAIIIVFMTLNPFVLYLMQELPNSMPIVFDSNFNPSVWGSGKQFAFKQMTYGAMNMIILFCMHYSSYFCARYDKKSAYKYIYIALIIAASFLYIQLKILFTFI